MLPDRFDWESFLAAQRQPYETRGEFMLRRRTAEWRLLRRKYVDSSAPETVALWKRFRAEVGGQTLLERYGLGRSEFVPVRKEGAITEYLGQYLEAGIKIRIHGWKGARRVETDRRTSINWKTNGRQFSWVSPGARAWRDRVGQVAKMIRINSADGIKEILGPRWAYWMVGYMTAPESEWQEVAPRLVAILAQRHICARG